MSLFTTMFNWMLAATVINVVIGRIDHHVHPDQESIL
jgi:hypothetical protein